MAEKDNLDKYVDALQDLNVDKKKHKYTAGKSPHKPVLLLSVIALYKNDKLNLRDIKPNQEIKEKWLELWNCLEYEESAPIWKPFYYMKSEDFWNIEFSQNKEADSVTSLQSFNEVVEKVSLDKDLIELIDDEESWLTLVDALLTGGYFSKEEKNKLASKMALIDESYESDKNEHRSVDQESVSETTSDEAELDTQIEHRISQNHIENIFDKSNIDTRELLEVLDTDDDQLRLKLILALQSSQNSKILKDKKFKDKIINLILVEDDSLVKENIRSLIHEAYDNHAYFINKLLALLNDEDPQIRSNVAESLKIFDTRRVNKHLIDKLYDEEIEVRFSALKTLLQNDNYDLGEIEKALENWKTSLQVSEKAGEEESESEEEETKTDRSVEEKEDVDESLSWNEAVKEAISRVVEREGDHTFSRQTLIEEEMDYIKKATGTEGSSPKQTLSRVLQELWKEEDFISHEKKGVYKLQKGETKEELEAEKTKEKKSRQEKEELLIDISEEKIDLEEVKDKIIRYSKDEDFLKQLLGHINELDWKYRYQLIKIISEINEKIVLEKLTKLLEDPNEWVREASAEALTNFPGDDVIPKLADALKSSEKERSRIYAAEILGEFDSEKALDALNKALEDEAPSVREEALSSINKISNENARKILKRAKKSEFSDVKSEAERILRSAKYNKSEDKNKPKKAKTNDSLFTKNRVYLRSKVHERLGGKSHTKLSKSANNNHIFLFYRKDEEYKHPFGWQDDGSFHFILDKFKHEIQFGDSNPLKNYKKDNQKMHLFRELEDNKVKYQGQMKVEKYNAVKVKDEVKKIILKLLPVQNSTKKTTSSENKDYEGQESPNKSNVNQVNSDSNEKEKEDNEKSKDMVNNLKEEFELD